MAGRRRGVPLPVEAAGWIALAVVLAELLPRLDDRLATTSGSLLGSRANASVVVSVLSTVAGGMIAFCGFVFAIVLLALQFGTSTFSARLVPMFQRDLVVRSALGVFVATFLYCLFAATAVDTSRGELPVVTAVVAQLFAVASVVMFFALVHRVGTMLRTVSLLRDVARRGHRAVAQVHPAPEATETAEAAEADALDTGATPRPDRDVAAGLGVVRHRLHHDRRSGVLLDVDVSSLVRIAERLDTVLTVVHSPGDFVSSGSVVVESGTLLDDGAIRRIRRSLHFGLERTAYRDPTFALRVLTDVALRALPPTNDDPTTAVQALDYVEDLLRNLAGRQLGAAMVHGGDGRLRLRYRRPTWDEYLSLGVDEVRLAGVDSLQVARRLRAALTTLAAQCPPARRAPVTARLQALDDVLVSRGRPALDLELFLSGDRQGVGGPNATHPQASDHSAVSPR